MKLQLNESTLNAYINEAIRQELNEAFRVDFEKLGTPTGPVKRGWGFARPERVKTAMSNGTYGRTRAITHKKFVNDLKALGYDTEQIQNGIQNGAIKIGRNFGSGPSQQFLPHNNLRRQNRRDARLRTAAGMSVSNSQSDKTQDKNQTETKNGGFDGAFPWDNTTPVWTPRKRSTPAPAPEETPAQPERQKLEPLAPVQAPANMPTSVTTNGQPGLIQRQPQQSLAQSAVQVMNQTANQSNMGLRNRISTNRRTKQNANNAIDQMVRDGSMPRQQARDDKKLIKGAEKALRTGEPMN